MNILITGANGFMGRNLRQTISNARPQDTLMPIDVQSTDRERREAAQKADFVFHLAGVNRPRNLDDYMAGNRDFTVELLEALKAGQKPPVLLSSSTQAALDNPYGKSKLAAEEAVRAYGAQTGSPVCIYRLTNAFGKWSRPNYNSVVATFCHNIARDLPITVDDPAAELHLNYIDDIVREFLRALDGMPTRGKDGFCTVEPSYRIGLGELAALLGSFRDMREALSAPDQTDPLTAKLYATYVSFLPPEDFACVPVIHSDARGSFAELLHLGGYGQVSVNITKPHMHKGGHWHQTKHEKFIVVAGEGLIRLRKPEEETVIEYHVDGTVPKVVDIPPGYTHDIVNTGDEEMITIMWASECYNPARPDTYRLPVDPGEEA